MSDPSELILVRVSRAVGSELCQTWEHRGRKRPRAAWIVYKPYSDPPLPGPDVNYLCRDCMDIFLRETALPENLFL